MALLLSPFIVLCVSVSLVAVTGKSPNTENPVTSVNATSSVNTTQYAGDGAKPTLTPDNELTMLAFGVISFILILIIVMVILVTAVNLRGRCNNTKEEGIKSYGSVISEGHISNIGERESIMLVSMRTINTDTDTDSPRISSIYSTALDSEDQ